MPVPLPPAPAGGTPLPEEPNDPPTLEDVYNAVQYFSEVKVDHETQMADAATQDDVARAAVYQTAVSVAHAADSQLLNKILSAVAHPSTDAVPPWFAPMLTKALNNAFAPLKRSIARNYNLQCADGNIRYFEIVPFQDGSLPEEYGLPALTSAKAIQDLSGQQASDYLAGYGLQDGLPAEHLTLELQRKRAIGREIGCTITINE